MQDTLKTMAKWAKVPVGLLQIATHAKSFQNNPVIGSRHLNQMGLHRTRCRLAMQMAKWRRSKLASSISPQERSSFEDNGFFLRYNALQPEHFKRLREEVGHLRASGWEMRQGKTVTRRISLDDDVLQVNPGCSAFVRDRNIRDLIAYASSHAGGITYQLQSILVDASHPSTDPQTRLHADTFHATAKAWLFLDDVDDTEGPFCYVPGSHHLTPARLQWEYYQSINAANSAERMHREGSFRINESELASLDLPSPQRFAVPANTLVVADTCGFHARCPSLHPSHRVEIYASLRRNPFLPWCGGHLFALPQIAEHHMLWDIRLKHLMGFKKHTNWICLEHLNAYEPAHV